MAREFTAADILQSVIDFDLAVDTFTPTLTTPAAEGHTGMLMGIAAGVINPPEGWHKAAVNSPAAPGCGVWCRPGLLDQEQAWTITYPGSGNFMWIVQEWANISFACMAADSAASGITGSVASVASGSTGTWDAPYVVGIAVCGIRGSISATTAFSDVTWSNSFTETYLETIGTGQNQGDLQLRVALRYGTQGETGPWDTTVTWTDGAQTAKTQMLSLAVFRAENYEGDI